MEVVEHSKPPDSQVLCASCAGAADYALDSDKDHEVRFAQLHARQEATIREMMAAKENFKYVFECRE